MTAKSWWMSFSSCAMVVSTVDACPFCVLFSNLANWVHAIILLAGGVSADCVCDLVLCAGAVVWNVVLCFFVLCLRCFLNFSTLGTDGVDNEDNWRFGGFIDLICHVLLLEYRGTLELVGSHVFVVGVSSIDALCCIGRPVIWISWLIYSYPFPLPNSCIALAQSVIAAITFSSCVMVVRMRFLWLKCIFSVKRSMLVDFMWHLCVC